jgi:hypothetical protein
MPWTASTAGCGFWRTVARRCSSPPSPGFADADRRPPGAEDRPGQQAKVRIAIRAVILVALGSALWQWPTGM